MAYQVLARKYRPQRFSDVVGQDHVTRTLLNALAQDRIAHGYIFSGHRGIGKTTIARILAAALNCRTPVGDPARPNEEPCLVCVNCREISSASRQETSIFEESHSFDVEEIDAATNRGIDDARLLTTKIQTRPTNKSKYRIIILDEAHQITDAAWNALLKTLEEPPAWAVFMFATTQPEDIPQTIRSRCQHFSFHAVKLDDIVAQLRSIAGKESLIVDDATLTLLAEAGDGSMRDALSIMDQTIASAPLVDGRPALDIDQVRELMGSVSNVVYEQLLEAVRANNSADVLAITGRLLDAGNAAPQLARQFVRYLRNCIVAKITGLSADPNTAATGIAADLLQISPEERLRAARSAALFTEEDLSRFLSIMLRTFDDLGYRQEQRFHLELGLLKLVHVQRLLPIEDLLTQLGPAAKPSITTTPSTPSATPSAPKSSVPSATSAASKSSGPSSTEGFTPGRGPAAPAASTSRPTASPFEADSSRKSASTASSPSAATDGSLALADLPEDIAPPHARPHLVAASTEITAANPEPESIHTATIHTATIVCSPIVAPSDALDLAGLQQAFIAALAAVKGQQSASEQLEESHLSHHGDTLEIHTTVSAQMLPLVLNAEAERILKAVLRKETNAGLKLKLFPGAPVAASAKKPTRASPVGSAAELAAKHPMVQQAQRLFSAEIGQVIDLRDKS